MSVSNNPSIISNGLILALDAADKNSYPGTGTAWTDLSGNGNNGTLVNGPTFNTGSLGSIVLDGVDDYVNIPNASSLNPTVITISSWFYLNALLVNQNIISKDSGGGVSPPYIQYSLKMSGTTPFNTVDFQASIGGTNRSLSSTTTLVTSRWYNVVGTYDGTTFRIYVNGIQEANTLVAAGIITSYNTPVQIGRWNGNGSQYLSGRIANTQLYNRALSAAEVLQNYTVMKTRFGL